MRALPANPLRQWHKIPAWTGTNHYLSLASGILITNVILIPHPEGSLQLRLPAPRGFADGLSDLWPSSSVPWPT